MKSKLKLTKLIYTDRNELKGDLWKDEDALQKMPKAKKNAKKCHFNILL